MQLSGTKKKDEKKKNTIAGHRVESSIWIDRGAANSFRDCSASSAHVGPYEVNVNKVP